MAAVVAKDDASRPSFDAAVTSLAAITTHRLAQQQAPTQRPRAPLEACLSCGRCQMLMQDPATIAECLHSFCKLCIDAAIEIGSGNNRCPVCQTGLGGDPYALGKIRPDRQLAAILARVFPTDAEAASQAAEAEAAIRAAIPHAHDALDVALRSVAARRVQVTASHHRAAASPFPPLPAPTSSIESEGSPVPPPPPPDAAPALLEVAAADAAAAAALPLAGGPLILRASRRMTAGALATFLGLKLGLSPGSTLILRGELGGPATAGGDPMTPGPSGVPPVVTTTDVESVAAADVAETLGALWGRLRGRPGEGGAWDRFLRITYAVVAATAGGGAKGVAQGEQGEPAAGVAPTADVAVASVLSHKRSASEMEAGGGGEEPVGTGA